MSLRVSVAMALFNGEKYLLEQLDSIKNQTVQPFELYATDDGSTDSTRAIFEKFVADNGLEQKWHYHRNDVNLGYSENFLRCAEMCSGDVVFFSDQDDIWDTCKIEKMISVLNNHNDVEAVVCGYLLYCDGKIINSFTDRLKKIHQKSGVVPFSTQVKDLVSGGLTLCVRKEILLNVSEVIRNNNLVYDTPIGLICASRKTLYRIREPLVYHRIHTYNTGDPVVTVEGRISDYERHIKGRQFEYDMLSGCSIAFNSNLNERELKAVNHEVRVRQDIIICLREKKLLKLFCYIFRVGKYDNKLVDIANFICCFKSKTHKNEY